MEGSPAANLTTRSLLRGILATEPVRTAVKNKSKRGNLQPSMSFAHQDEISSSPSMNLRTKMKERIRRSLRRSGVKSPVLKRKVDTNSQTTVKSVPKRAFPLMEDLDDITPRTLLKKIIENEDEVSLVVSQRSKAAAADGRNSENSPTAQLSRSRSSLNTEPYIAPPTPLIASFLPYAKYAQKPAIPWWVPCYTRWNETPGPVVIISYSVGDVNLSLPELEDTEYVTLLRKAGKKRKLRVSEFEREVDKRLTMNNDNDNVSLDSFASSSSRANSCTLARPFETKLDNSGVPETTFRKVLVRRPNKVCLLSVDDFEQGVDDKYQLLKGSQECFIPPAMEDRSEASSNNLALMNNELYTQSLRKDANTPKSEHRKQRSASKLFLLSQDERKEGSGELSERGTRKLKAYDRPIEENVTKDVRGDHREVIEDSDGREDREDGVVHVSDQAVDNSSKDSADNVHGSGEVVDDSSEDGADDVHGSGEVTDDSEDEADDGHAAGEVTNDNSEDEADDGHTAGKEGADVVLGSGDVADDGHAAGKGADVFHSSGDVTDDNSEDEADDGRAAGKEGADVFHGSGEVTDDNSEDEADDAHAASIKRADVVHGSGEVTDDSSEDEADDDHAASKRRADVVHDSGEVTDDRSEDEADDGHVAGEEGADVYGSGEAEDDSDEDEADEGNAGEVEDDDEADDVHVEAKVADDLPDNESNMQPNKSSVTLNNRKSSGVADYAHPEQRSRLSSRLSYGNNMKTAESVHLQSISISRPEEGSELLETTGDESLDLAMSRELEKVESNQLVLEELAEPPPYMKSIRFVHTDKPAPVRKKIQRTKCTKPKKSGSVFNSSQVKRIFNHQAQVRVSKEALTDVEKCLEAYMNQLASDLSAYTSHAKRKTITRADMELLMKRQRLVTDTTSLNVLIEKYLPLDCRTLLIPCAMSGNQVLPKLAASSCK